jgi:hypothetical protein
MEIVMRAAVSVRLSKLHEILPKKAQRWVARRVERCGVCVVLHLAHLGELLFPSDFYAASRMVALDPLTSPDD